MRPLWEGHGFRRASYWVLIAAFLTLSIYAGEQAFGLQQSLDDKEAERAQRELQALLSLWERSTLDRVTTWILDIAESDDPKTVEDRYRRSSRFFEGFYIWRAGPEGPKFQYPVPPIEEHIETLLADPCIAAAARLSDRMRIPSPLRRRTNSASTAIRRSRSSRARARRTCTCRRIGPRRRSRLSTRDRSHCSSRSTTRPQTA